MNLRNVVRGLCASVLLSGQLSNVWSMGQIPPPPNPSRFELSVLGNGAANGSWMPQPDVTMRLTMDDRVSATADGKVGQVVLYTEIDLTRPHRFTLVAVGLYNSSEPVEYIFEPASLHPCNFYASTDASLDTANGKVNLSSYWTGIAFPTTDGPWRFEQKQGYGVHAYQTPQFGAPRQYGTVDSWWDFSGTKDEGDNITVHTTGNKKPWPDQANGFNYAGIESLELKGTPGSATLFVNGNPEGSVLDFSLNCPNK